MELARLDQLPNCQDFVCIQRLHIDKRCGYDLQRISNSIRDFKNETFWPPCGMRDFINKRGDISPLQTMLDKITSQRNSVIKRNLIHDFFLLGLSVTK